MSKTIRQENRGEGKRPKDEKRKDNRPSVKAELQALTRR